VAWNHLRTPGPQPGYGLQGDELSHPDPRRRFARRSIQYLECPSGGAAQCETLALIDKASPHSLFDLMISEVSTPPKSTAADVHVPTGLTLWRSGLNFVHFCAEAADDFGLADGELHLALNCDPHTRDRESVQAAKQFHLHLLYWDAAALAPLEQAQSLDEIADRRLRRQALDPMSFLGARLVTEALTGTESAIPGASMMPLDDRAVVAGQRPLGAVLVLPGWEVLGAPGFEALIRRIHERLEWLAASLLEAFAGQRQPPDPWRRHPLLPLPEIQAAVGRLPFSEVAKAGLVALAQALRDMNPRTAERLARGTPGPRRDLMTLNQPCYALNLHAPGRAKPLAENAEVHLIIQPKLFSGIGGAGLLTLRGVPSVRIVRGERTFSADQWEQRARFQRAFACFNQERLLEADWPSDKVRPLPVARFAGPRQGWVAESRAARRRR